MTPVLLTIMMTVTIEWIPKEETGDRLSVLVTLFIMNKVNKPIWNNRSHFVSWWDFLGTILDNLEPSSDYL